jgi:nucleolar MIF4G domain-containing protein 1
MLERLNPPDEDLKMIKMLEKKLGIRKKDKEDEEEKPKKNDLKKYLEEKRNKKRDQKEDEEIEENAEKFDFMYDQFDSEDDMDDGLDDLFKPYDDDELEDVKKEILKKTGKTDDVTPDDILDYISGAFAFKKDDLGDEEPEEEEEEEGDEEQGVEQEQEQEDPEGDDDELSEEDEEEEEPVQVLKKEKPVETKNLGVYVPPSKRNLTVESERFVQLKKQIKGSMNKLTAENVSSITKDLIKLYETSSKNDFNHILSESILNSVCDPINLKTEFILVYSSLVSALHLVCGIEFGSDFLEKTILHFESIRKTEKQKSMNLILFISYLFNFEVRFF